MRNMMQALCQQLSAGADVVLVTVTAALGATPRGAGARMLVNDRGRLCGTIGGGAVEYRAIQIAQTVLSEHAPVQYDFSLTGEDVQNLGMICGGAVQVFFHYLSAGDEETIHLARNAMRLLSEPVDLWLLSDLSGGGRLSLYTKQNSPPWLLPHLSRRPKRLEKDDWDLFLEQIGFSGRVYIFGGGHVARELVPILSHVGFRCIVMDDRPEFSDPSLFPAAEQVLRIDFTRISDYISLTQEDYACVMTRGHAYDTLVQAQLLRLLPCYIGVIGSAAKAAGVRKALIEEYGFSDNDINRITTPIGLKIGAETPGEIAISIAAQMIAIRAAQKEQ